MQNNIFYAQLCFMTKKKQTNDIFTIGDKVSL